MIKSSLGRHQPTRRWDNDQIEAMARKVVIETNGRLFLVDMSKLTNWSDIALAEQLREKIYGKSGNRD